MLRGRRGVSADQTDLARSRVTALSRRRGWVPRVPAPSAWSALAAPELAEAGMMAIGDAAPDRPAGDDQRGPTRTGRHARPAEHDLDRPAGGAGDAQASFDWPDGFDGGAGAESTRNAVTAAIAERLPLPVRAVVEGLPPGVRNGRAGLKPAHAAVVVLVVLLGLAVTAMVTGLGRPRVQAIEPVPGATILATGTPATAPDSPAAAADAGAVLVVHVAGKVANPGIVQLPPGSRVIDAIEAVGGAEKGVDLTPLNLARVLSDGEQVVVGIDLPPQPATGQQPAGAVLVSLNSASPEQLTALPGIGPTLAARIVQWREQNGRFTAVDELLEVAGIGPAKYEAIAELVTL